MFAVFSEIAMVSGIFVHLPKIKIIFVFTICTYTGFLFFISLKKFAFIYSSLVLTLLPTFRRVM